jgi:hypothetical protein
VIRPERRFLLELALVLHKTPRELAREMTMADMMEWDAFFRLKAEEGAEPAADLGTMSPDQIAAAFGAKMA